MPIHCTCFITFYSCDQQQHQGSMHRNSTRSTHRSSSSSSYGSLANGASQTGRGPPRTPSLASLVLEADELIYITRLKDILESFPNKGPPYEPTQLSTHVFIGNQRNADDLGLLRRLGITHVVNCCGNRKLSLHLNPYPRISGIFRYIAFAAEDHSDYSILQHLPEVVEFLDHCKRQGGRALVHCNLGINRSGAICAAYLMLDEKVPLLRICELLKKKRSVVLGNKGFRRQLVKFARAHGLLDPVVESRSSYLARSGSVTTLPEYSEYSVEVAPGEAGSRPLSRTSSTPVHHQRSYSTGGQFQRTPYRAFNASSSPISSMPPLDETQSAPPTPTRFHPAYCTLPRGAGLSRDVRSLSSSSLSNKRPIAASHYDQDYFMDTIPEDSHHRHLRQPKEASTATEGKNKAFTPSRHSLVNLSKLGKKSKNQKIDEKTGAGDGEWVISSTRPLRVYKRSSTDSVLYQKPSLMHQYKRADTVATTDIATGMDKLRMSEDREEGRLTQKHRSSSRSSLVSFGSGFFNKFKSRSRTSLQNY